MCNRCGYKIQVNIGQAMAGVARAAPLALWRLQFLCYFLIHLNPVSTLCDSCRVHGACVGIYVTLRS